MGFITFIFLMIQRLFLLPRFVYWISLDGYHYYKEKWYKNFEYWGLHVYTGRFGAGKTSSMVYDAYKLAKAFPQLTILTNLKLQNFPVHTQILHLKTAQDILKAPKNTLVLIDEIGTIFNSRDFSKSKESVPKILFQHLCQCRKRRMMIYATSQRWNFVDKQLRDIVATVRECNVFFSHPFARMGTIKEYDSVEYDRNFANPLVPAIAYTARSYIQSNKVRQLYDTSELIDNMLSAEYVDDEEILRNRGDLDSSNVIEISKEGRKAYKKSIKRK